jgi:predicted CDP-diglyceride synthetase/phosphatidate cytidylyltransferase
MNIYQVNHAILGVQCELNDMSPKTLLWVNNIFPILKYWVSTSCFIILIFASIFGFLSLPEG